MKNDVFDAMRWTNEPPYHAVKQGVLTVQTGMKTDFWQETHYGFHRDDGHFLAGPQSGQFSATVAFQGHYNVLYDQAGLMIRVDQDRWIKCGVEYTDGQQHFSVVVTHGQSDWSAFKIEPTSEIVFARMTRLKDAVFVQYSLDGLHWAMARLAYFPRDLEVVQAGVYCCSPERAGFEVTFSQFEIDDPVSKDIH